MSDLNIADLKRKAGCSDQLYVMSRHHDPSLITLDHGKDTRDFDTQRPEWANGVIEWLRGLKHE